MPYIYHVHIRRRDGDETEIEYYQTQEKVDISVAYHKQRRTHSCVVYKVEKIAEYGN